jgi:uncharacterized protein (DUF1697 family)
MTTYILLMRGINVGGKNKVPMPELKRFLEGQGLSDVATYMQSGNAIVQSALAGETLSRQVESGLPRAFTLDSSIIRVLALTAGRLRKIVDDRPEGFGDEPDTYHSDVIYLMGIGAAEALKIFSPRAGVDQVWPGGDVIYSQRLTALRTKSRLNRIMASPLYQSMTIRSWSTTMKLLDMVRDADADDAAS